MTVSLVKDSDLQRLLDGDFTHVAEDDLRSVEVMTKVLHEMRDNGPAPTIGSWEFYIEQVRLSVLGLAPTHAFTDPTLCDGPAMAMGLKGTMPTTSAEWRDLLIDIFAMQKACEYMNGDQPHITKLLGNLDLLLTDWFDMIVERNLIGDFDLALLVGAIARIMFFADSMGEDAENKE